MDEITETPEVVDEPAVPEIPTEPAPPISSRFLFVDVAALRAKQLRRGARLRFEAEPGVPTAIKLERLAMEEVKRGLVYYNVPPLKPKNTEEAAS